MRPQCIKKVGTVLTIAPADAMHVEIFRRHIGKGAALSGGGSALGTFGAPRYQRIDLVGQQLAGSERALSRLCQPVGPGAAQPPPSLTPTPFVSEQPAAIGGTHHLQIEPVRVEVPSTHGETGNLFDAQCHVCNGAASRMVRLMLCLSKLAPALQVWLRLLPLWQRGI